MSCRISDLACKIEELPKRPDATVLLVVLVSLGLGNPDTGQSILSPLSALLKIWVIEFVRAKRLAKEVHAFKLHRPLYVRLPMDRILKTPTNKADEEPIYTRTEPPGIFANHMYNKLLKEPIALKRKTRRLPLNS